MKYVLIAVALLMTGCVSTYDVKQSTTLHEALTDVVYFVDSRGKGRFDRDTMPKWIDHSVALQKNDEHFIPDTCTHYAATYAGFASQLAIERPELGIVSVVMMSGTTSTLSTKGAHAVTVVLHESGKTYVMDNLNPRWVRDWKTVNGSSLPEGFTVEKVYPMYHRDAQLSSL